MTPPLYCRPTPQRGGFALFLRTNEESSLTSPARSAHHPPTSIRFARSVRKKPRTFRRKSTRFSKNQPTFRRESPTFSSLPTAYAGQRRISSHSHSHSQAIFPIPLSPSHRSAESNCQFVSRRPRVGADFRALLPLCSRHKGRKTTTSKHILIEYIRRDTYFLSFLSLTDKKVVHLQRIDK